MVKRAKRLEKGIESLKKEIDEHFSKIEQDLAEGNVDRGRYHVKVLENHAL